MPVMSGTEGSAFYRLVEMMSIYYLKYAQARREENNNEAIHFLGEAIKIGEIAELVATNEQERVAVSQSVSLARRTYIHGVFCLTH